MKGWNDLDTLNQFQELLERSSLQTIVVFKHSTRCSISTMAQRRLLDLNTSQHPQTAFYYLDLIAYRSVSNQIAESLSEEHKSPQVLVIKNQSCVYEASHMEISQRELLDFI